MPITESSLDTLRQKALTALNAQNPTQAIPLLKTLVEHTPNNMDAWDHLAAALMMSGDYEQAEQAFQQCFRLGCVFPETLKNAVCNAKYWHKPQLQLDHAQRLLDFDGELRREGLRHYAEALRNLGRSQDALAACQQLLLEQPDDVAIQQGIVRLLLDLGKADQALSLCQTLRVQHAEHRGLWLSEIEARIAVGELEQGIALAEQLLERDPDNLEALGALGFHYQFLPDMSVAQRLAHARRFGEALRRQITPYQNGANSLDPNKVLRVGLVSGDLRHHPVGFFLQSALTALQNSSLQFWVYDTLEKNDTITEQIRPLITHWQPVKNINDQDLAQLIREQQIDILIDLHGYTTGQRLRMMAYKPAPVQLSYIGFLGSTGTPGIDYVLADRFCVPEGTEDEFTEQVWRLPDYFCCFTLPDSNVSVVPPPVLNNGYITFGCLNKPHKINNRVLALWSQILAQLPESRLLLKGSNFSLPRFREHFIQRLQAAGIDPIRVMLETQSPRTHYLQTYQRIDIALDPFPYSGGTTTVEALWAGVPMLSLKGDRMMARVGCSLLHAAGLHDWLAETPEQFVDLAVAKASDIDGLVALRKRQREHVLQSPLFDALRFARQLEQTLRDIWRHCVQASVAIEVKPMFTVMPGFTADHKQSVLYAEITLNLTTPVDVASLTAGLAPLLETKIALANYSQTGDALAELIVAGTVALQKKLGYPVYDAGKAEFLAERNSFCLSIPYHDAHHTFKTLQEITTLVNRLIDERTNSLSAAMRERFDKEQGKLRQLSTAYASTNTPLFLKTANAKNIPWMRLVGNCYQYGYGAQSRRLDSSITDVTPALAVNFAKNKVLTAQLLRQAGFPVPDHAIAVNADQAVLIAAELGYPVVIKPMNMDKGLGVYAGILDESSVRRTFAAAAQYSSSILVERYIDGVDYRMNVIAGEVEWITRRTPAHVMSDGISTVQQLIDVINSEPRRQSGLQQTLSPIKVDEETSFILKEQQLDLMAVPEAGRWVRLARNANVASGGITERIMLNEVHPENLSLAIRAADCIGLDIAGIDLLISDLSQPWHQQAHVGICEVNAQPQMGINADKEGVRYYGILDTLLNGSDGRIPIAVISGDQTDSLAALILHQLLLTSALHAGVSTRQGCRIGSEQVTWKNKGSYFGSRLLLSDKRVAAAVIELPIQDYVEQGSAFDQCDMLALLSVTKEHASSADLHSPSALTLRYRALLQRARKTIVLNADDADCLDQRQYLNKQDIILVSTDVNQPDVLEHLQQGGRAVCLTGINGAAVLSFAQGEHQEIVLLSPGSLRGNQLSTLAAAALAWSFAMPIAAIERGLRSVQEKNQA